MLEYLLSEISRLVEKLTVLRTMCFGGRVHRWAEEKRELKNRFTKPQLNLVGEIQLFAIKMLLK